MTKKVYVSTANGRTRYYHTDRECYKLDKANTIHSYTLESIKRTNRELCSVCENDGEHIPSNSQGSGHYESLLRAAKNEGSV